jgi:hypothetical protein
MARIGEKGNVCSVLIGKPEGSRQLARLKFRWGYNIKIGAK